MQAGEKHDTIDSDKYATLFVLYMLKSAPIFACFYFAQHEHNGKTKKMDFKI